MALHELEIRLNMHDFRALLTLCSLEAFFWKKEKRLQSSTNSPYCFHSSLENNARSHGIVHWKLKIQKFYEKELRIFFGWLVS